MSDQQSSGAESGRLDLTALDAMPDERRAERLLQAVMERVETSAASTAVWRSLDRVRFGMAVAAAVLVMVATTMVIAEHRQAGDSGTAGLLEDWALAAHVPTNAELLFAYQGYGR